MKSHNIFISYRRDGGFETAKMIQEKLKSKNYSVFLDYEELRSGKFNEQLYQKIENCKDFILICSPRSFDRCANTDDWLRLEILHAMKHKKNIIPVVLRNFEWPKTMPFDLEELAFYHRINSSEELFDSFITKLQNHYLKSKSNPLKSNKNLIIAIIPIICTFSFFLYLYFQPIDITIQINDIDKTENLIFDKGTISITYGDKTESMNIFDEIIFKNISSKYKYEKLNLKFEANGYHSIDTLVKAQEYTELKIQRDNTLGKIFGTVNDENNLPMNQVRINILDINTQTNEFGQFLINIPINKQNKTQRITASKNGYQPYDKIMPVFYDVETRIILKR